MTSGEPDEEHDQAPKSSDPYKTLGLSASKHQQSISSNRFETPAHDNKNQVEAPKKAEPKVSAYNKGSKPNFMMNKKIGEMPMRDQKERIQ